MSSCGTKTFGSFDMLCLTLDLLYLLMQIRSKLMISLCQLLIECRVTIHLKGDQFLCLLRMREVDTFNS